MGRARSAAATKPLSATQRKAAATQQLVSALGGNQSVAITAALEIVNERMAHDAAFQQSVRSRYEELAILAAPRPKPVRESAPKPVAISTKPRAATLEELNPYHMLEDYGRDQLRAKLQGTTQRRLRSAVDIVQAHNPGTKPTSRTINAAMIDYIVEQLAGPGY
jgi:hypothetical protein